MEKLAMSLKRRRKEAGLTQQDLADQLHVARQSISKWETGETVPTIENLLALREIFNLSLDEIVTGHLFLKLPFQVGKPQREGLLLKIFLLGCFPCLLALIVFYALGWPLLLGTSLSVVILAISGILLAPFYYKSGSQIWTITTTGIAYCTELTYLQRLRSFLKKDSKPTQFIPYADIETLTFFEAESKADNLQPTVHGASALMFAMTGQLKPKGVIVKAKGQPSFTLLFSTFDFDSNEQRLNEEALRYLVKRTSSQEGSN